jgi:ribose 5-phosphate isomerase RpiB
LIFTARQLEDLHKSNGHVVLPYGARLTPLAVDWARGKKIVIGYGPDELVKQSNGAKPASAIGVGDGAKPQAVGAFLWWCDGPCGAAKAAVGAQAKESSLSPVDLPGEAKQLVAVIKKIAAGVKEGKSNGGVLLVQSAAAAVVLANRCPSLRAIVGTSLESLEAAISQIAANVLVLEYPNKSFSQLKNLLSRFVRAKRELSDEIKKQIEELGTCG